MKTLKLLIPIMLLAALAGCSSTMKTTTYAPDGITKQSEVEQPGSMFGPSSYDVGFAGMYGKWRDSQGSRASNIVSLPCPDDPIAASYCGQGKMMGIAMMSMERFDVAAPTTGFDVLNTAAKQITGVAGIGGMLGLGKAAIDGAGATFGNNATVSNSMNRTTSTSLNTGTNGVVNATSSGTMPASEPVIVVPSYAPVQ